MNTPPRYLKKYFWDVNFLDLDKDKYAYFIIRRLLEEGNKKSIQWMRDTYELDKIKEVIYHSKSLSGRSANFWQVILNLNRGDIPCLDKSYLKKQKAI